MLKPAILTYLSLLWIDKSQRSPDIAATGVQPSLNKDSLAKIHAASPQFLEHYG